MNIKRFIDISILKTLRFNIYYFGIRNGLKFPVIISRKVLLKSLKGKVIISCPLKIGLVRIGFDTLGIVDRKNDRAIWENTGTIEFRGNCILGSSMKICTLERGYITIGKRVKFTGMSTLISEKNIELGDNCLISWNVQLMDTDFHEIYDYNGVRINHPKQIKIGNHVWIGSRAIVLKGSIIPDNSVIAAGSIVTKALITKNTVYAGNPANSIKNNIEWQE